MSVREYTESSYIIYRVSIFIESKRLAKYNFLEIWTYSYLNI